MEVKELVRLKVELESIILNLLRDFSRLHKVNIDNIHMDLFSRMTIGKDVKKETIIQEVKLDIRL